MGTRKKQASNPYSTGGGGFNFETRVQASFAALMLSGGFAPTLPRLPIYKIKLQGKFLGYETDDLIVFAGDPKTSGHSKLLGQVKHSIGITEQNAKFGEVILSAWSDFNNSELFTKNKDVIALITGPLSALVISSVRTLLEKARHSENAIEYFQLMALEKVTSDAERSKLKAFRVALNKANNDKDVTDSELYNFLRHFHLLGYDLDIKSGVILALLHSLIGQYSQENTELVWSKIVEEVQYANQHSGTLQLKNFSKDLLSIFKKKEQVIPEDLVKPALVAAAKFQEDKVLMASLTAAMLIGGWDDTNPSDIDSIRKYIDGL